MNDITAVILAAGKGKRMLPLTETRPKPLQMVGSKNLIEWKLAALPDQVRDIVLVIGYQGEQIRDFFGDNWGGRPIRYVVQEELNGTAGALGAARKFLDGDFIVMMGDDLYAKKDIENVLEYDLAVCVQEIKNKEMGGEMTTNPDGTFCGVNEERHFVKEGLVNTGLYKLNMNIFAYPPVPIGGSSTEFGLPHTLTLLAKDLPVQVIRATKWIQITTPEDLARAEKEFLS